MEEAMVSIGFASGVRVADADADALRRTAASDGVWKRRRRRRRRRSRGIWIQLTLMKRWVEECCVEHSFDM